MNDILSDGFCWYIIFLYSTVLHEAAHAWVAWKLGDDTAHRGGQVSLDPVPHIKRAPFGMVVVPLLSFWLSGYIIGWAHIPYSLAWAYQYPNRCAKMALAGPAANGLLALVALLLIKWGIVTNHLHLATTFSVSHWIIGNTEVWSAAGLILNIALFLNMLCLLFNLLPLPPLDGASLPLLFLKGKAAEGYLKFVHHPQAAMAGMFISWKLIPWLLPAIGSLLTQLFS